MKIKFLNNGGVTGFMDYEPVSLDDDEGAVQQGAAPSESSEKASDDSKGKLTEKDFYNMLKTVDGLPSDIQALMQDVSRLTNFKDIFAGTPFAQTSNLSQLYISALTKLKVAKFNKEQFDEAYKEMTSKDCLNDVAITAGGGVMVMDANHNISEVSVQDYLSNRGKFQALTNSNLLSMRAEGKDYAFQNNVLNVVKNGVGMKSIMESIDAVTKGLGSSQLTANGYISKQGEQIGGAIELLQVAAQKGGYTKGATVEGLYKAKLITKDQAEALSQALQFLIKALPQNQLAWLKLKSGNANNPEKGALDMLTQILTSKNTEELSLDLDFQENLNPDGTKKSSSDEDKLKLSPAELFIQGQGEDSVVAVRNETGDTINLITTTLPVTKGGDPIGQTKAIDLTTSDFGGILDMQNASMGGHRITGDGLNQVLVNGSAAHKVVFPVERQADGTIVPNLKMLKKMEEVRALIKAKNATTPDQINAIYKEQGLPILIVGTNPDGSPKYNMTDYDTFAVFDATATNKAFGKTIDVSDHSLLEIEDKGRIENTLDMIYGTGKDRKEIDWDDRDWKEDLYSMFGGSPEYDQLLEGTLWIRCRTNMMNAMAGSGTKPTINQANNIRQKTQQNERLQNANVAGQLQL